MVFLKKTDTHLTDWSRPLDIFRSFKGKTKRKLQ